MDRFPVDNFTNVERVSQQVGEGTDAKAYPTTGPTTGKNLSFRAMALTIQFFHERADRPQFEIAPKNLADRFGFLENSDDLFAHARALESTVRPIPASGPHR